MGANLIVSALFYRCMCVKEENIKQLIMQIKMYIRDIMRL